MYFSKLLKLLGSGLGSCKVDGTAHYAEDYATQRIYVTCGVWHGRSRCKIMPERRYAQNNSRKTDFLEKLGSRSRLPCSAYFNRLVGHRIFTTDVFMILRTPRSIR